MALAPTRSRQQRTYNSITALWTPEEDEMLTNIVNKNPHMKWTEISKFFPNKTVPQVSGRWNKALKPDLIKGSWTKEEDETIIQFISINGDKDWSKLAILLPGRIGKQCRERWINHLNPEISKKGWCEDEDKLLIELHEKFGNQWANIAKYFNGRTDNCVKNRWNSTLKRRLERVANGEPAIKKRGRKSKSEQNLETSPISSPPPVCEIKQEKSIKVMAFSIPFINLIPQFIPKNCVLLSLEENRNQLTELLKQ